MDKNIQVVAIVGETASGKTGAAIELALRHDGEVVSADSWAVYRGFDIGTAKPTPSELRGVPIHMIDVADPSEGYSAAEFKWSSEQLIADIQSRGKLPIIAGGTGLYVDSVLYDFSFLPAGEPGERDRLNAMTIDELLAEIEVRNIDLADIDTRNKRRLIRLLEVGGQRPEHGKLREGVLYAGITVPRDELLNRIVSRVDTMIAAGLADEVLNLSKKYGWDAEPMKGIGYREWREYFDGTFGLEQTRDRIISATNGLAKRQRTWFKRNPDIAWYSDAASLVDDVSRILNKPA